MAYNIGGNTDFFNQPSLISQKKTQPKQQLYSLPTGQQTTQYGAPEYQQALQDYQNTYGTYASMMNQVTPALQQMMQYYQPGGGYGQGLRTEAQETVQAGVGKDIGSMVASGMSSQAGARGLQTRANLGLETMYKNIEDTRNQLQQQAIQPYAQMMQSLGQMQQARPTYGQYVKPVTTEKYAYGMA